MSVIPYMPFYVADYMADTSHLSTEEHGAYLLLILAYWQRQKPLPGSDERLSNVVRMSNDRWQSVKPALIEFFTVVDGCWEHKRIDAELAKFFDKSEQAKRAGLASAKAKINRTSTGVERALNGRCDSVPTERQRNANHTDTDTDTKKKTHVQRNPLEEFDLVPFDSPNVSDPKATFDPEDHFEKWWRIYWRKTAKENARKSFVRACRSSKLFAAIIAGTKAQTPTMLQSEERFRPHGATWLNQRRWEDPTDAPMPQQPRMPEDLYPTYQIPKMPEDEE